MYIVVAACQELWPLQISTFGRTSIHNIHCLAYRIQLWTKMNNQSQLTQLWISRRVLRLYPTYPQCCLGLNRPNRNGCRKSCGDRISPWAVSEADVLLENMGACDPEEVLNSGRLEDLARLLLCGKWHRQGERSNVDRVVAEWTALIREHYVPPRTEDDRQLQTTNEFAPNTSASNLPVTPITFQAGPQTTSDPELQRTEAAHLPNPEPFLVSGDHIDTSRGETDAVLASPAAGDTDRTRLCEQQGANSHTTRSASSQTWCSNSDRGEARVRIRMRRAKVLAWLAEVPPPKSNQVKSQLANPMSLTLSG